MIHEALLALTLQCIGRGPDAARIAAAITEAVEDDAERAPLTGSHAEDACVLAVFARHESNASVNPRPWSWDAKAGLSHGPWQFPKYVARLPLVEQARTWLRWAREGGIAGLCGSGAAARRIAEARRAEAQRMLVESLNDDF